MADSNQRIACCIAGCGPAGAVLGLLLARAGVEVLVLEKHADFLRDFRGDTIHPSTLDILDQLGLADRFLQVPHTQVSQLSLEVSDGSRVEVNFNKLGGKFPFVAFVPQWDFLDFVTAEAQRYPTFRLLREAEVTGLVEEDDRITGVRYRRNDGEHSVRAELTVGADGRASVTRAAARLPLIESSPPMDVLWFRLQRRPGDGEDAALHLAHGRFAATFNRGEFWQVAFVIPKGQDAGVRDAGLENFQRSVAETVPELADRVAELRDWDQVKLLTVRSDHLRRWYRDGYLAIGDAAHAMSPVGGVGINIAIQDAVEAANWLWKPLLQGAVSTSTLKRVQRRRELSVRLVQAFQTLLQNRVLEPALRTDGESRPPAALGTLARLPVVGNVPARLLAYGVLRPHVRTPLRGCDPPPH